MQDKDKNTLPSFTHNYIDLVLNMFNLRCKRINILNQLTETFATLKPYKGNGIVLMNCSDYVSSVKFLFSNSSKFKQLDSDSTLTRV